MIGIIIEVNDNSGRPLITNYNFFPVMGNIDKKCNGCNGYYVLNEAIWLPDHECSKS